MKALVVSAHPDDELLGVGGTVARHVLEGDEVRLAVMCEGVSVRYGSARRVEVESQARRAASILGVTDIAQGTFPDQRLDTVSLVEVVQEVEKLVSAFEPDTVYTHFGGDVNRDHRILAEAVLVATRPYSAPSVREVLMFETPSSTEWGTRDLVPAFQPSVFVNIAGTLEKKIEAFLCYTAEVRPFPHPRSPEALRDRARYWGSLVNQTAAEAFVLVRSRR